jgi:DedD protein
LPRPQGRGPDRAAGGSFHAVPVFTEPELAESQDATLLQRRARRRLVGAIALVVLVVIVLPIVLDREPSPIGQDLVIQIPSQEAGKFNTRVLPPSAQGAASPRVAGGEGAKADLAKAEEAPKPAAVTAPVQAEQPAVPAEAKARSVPAPGAGKVIAPPARERAIDGPDASRAKALLEGKEAWIIRLGAFSSQDNVRQLQAKLGAAGVKSYTEPAKGPKGEQTRVRAGPFDSKLEAERAQEKLTAAGISPGTVAAR